MGLEVANMKFHFEFEHIGLVQSGDHITLSALSPRNCKA